MFKFIFDEAGAKTEKDREHNFGVVSGFILTDENKEKILINEVEKIVEKYNLKKLKKMHISEVRDIEKRKNIQLEILTLLNNLEIIWTYGSVKIGHFEIITKRERSEFGIPTLYENCLLIAFGNITDYYKNYYQKNNKIELISDNIDKKIKESFLKLLDKYSNKKLEEAYEITDGYDKEKKEPIIVAKLVVKTNIEPINVPEYILKTENNYLTFVADVLTYQTFQILKNKSSEKKLNCHKIMENHICKCLFIYCDEIDKLFNF